MSVSKITPTKGNKTHATGTAVITHAKGDADVFFVALVEGNPENPSLVMHSANYFTSGLLAETNFNDVSAGTKLIGALTGRSLPDMVDFLGKTSR